MDDERSEMKTFSEVEELPTPSLRMRSENKKSTEKERMRLRR